MIGRLSCLPRWPIHNVGQIYRIAANEMFRRFMATKPFEVRMPALSPTMSEGTIVKWLKNEGETISPGDALCEIQTDKAVMALEVEEQGILAKILVPDDSKEVKIGTLIALYVEEGEDWKDVQIPATSAATTTTPTVAPASDVPLGFSATLKTPPLVSTLHVHVGPAARSLLQAYGVEATIVAPTGPHGVLLKSDILNYIKLHSLSPKTMDSKAAGVSDAAPSAAKGSSKPAPSKSASPVQDFVDIPNSSMRLTIAKRLSQSKSTIPHSYCTVECYMDAVASLRRELKADGVKVTVNDFLIKAVAGALQRVPEVNAQWSDEGGARVLPRVDVSVAVATESGLITPIVADAAGLGLEGISEKVKELSDRARKGKLKLHEIVGGSFTISNLGMFGITDFSAIINPPQCAILAVGTSRLVPSEEGGAPRTRMSATMSYDRRAFDEQTAAHFLEVFASLMENPASLVALALPQKRHGVTDL